MTIIAQKMRRSWCRVLGSLHSCDISFYKEKERYFRKYTYSHLYKSWMKNINFILDTTKNEGSIIRRSLHTRRPLRTWNREMREQKGEVRGWWGFSDRSCVFIEYVLEGLQGWGGGPCCLASREGKTLLKDHTKSCTGLYKYNPYQRLSQEHFRISKAKWKLQPVLEGQFSSVA